MITVKSYEKFLKSYIIQKNCKYLSSSISFIKKLLSELLTQAVFRIWNRQVKNPRVMLLTEKTFLGKKDRKMKIDNNIYTENGSNLASKLFHK